MRSPHMRWTLTIRAFGLTAARQRQWSRQPSHSVKHCDLQPDRSRQQSSRGCKVRPASRSQPAHPPTRAAIHGPGIYATCGAAGACSHLLDIDVHGFEHAFTLAATQAAGVRRTFGTMGKDGPSNSLSGSALCGLVGRQFLRNFRITRCRPRNTHSLTSSKTQGQLLMGGVVLVSHVSALE